MKSQIKKFDLEKCWTLLFLLCFLIVSLVLIDKALLSALVCLAVCALAAYRWGARNYGLWLFLIALFLRVAVVLIVKTPAESDFAILFDAAQGVLAHDYSFLDTLYFRLWPYQMGFVFFQSLLLRLWNNILILKLFNCVISAATTVLVYLLAREFAGERSSRLVSLLYCFLPFPLFYVTVLSNQFFASFLIYLGIYLFLSSGITLPGWSRALLLAALLALANLLRPESVIPLLAAALYLILTARRQNFRENLGQLVILLAAYFALSRLISALFAVSGLSPDGLANNAPHWKFVLGFNHDTLGGYSNGDLPYLEDAGAAWAVVKERVLVPVPQLLRLFAGKIATFWRGGDLYWSFSYCWNTGLPLAGFTVNTAELVPTLTDMAGRLAGSLYLLVLIGVFRWAGRASRDRRVLLLVNQVFVTFGVYLLIEVQPRYFYHVQISVVILAALGVEALARSLRRRAGPPVPREGPAADSQVPERMEAHET